MRITQASPGNRNGEILVAWQDKGGCRDDCRQPLQKA